jgi:uncharacterized protein DUF397
MSINRLMYSLLLSVGKRFRPDPAEMQMHAYQQDVHGANIPNGIPASSLSARWRKSKRSNPTGACVELAELPGGRIAMRNSRHPDGPTLIYSRAQIAALVTAAKFNGLIEPSPLRYC